MTVEESLGATSPAAQPARVTAELLTSQVYLRSTVILANSIVPHAWATRKFLLVQQHSKL